MIKVEVYLLTIAQKAQEFISVQLSFGTNQENVKDLKIMDELKITVKDLIAHLEKLDQDKLIYVEYDSCVIFPPIPDMTDSDGNYVILAG